MGARRFEVRIHMYRAVRLVENAVSVHNHSLTTFCDNVVTGKLKARVWGRRKRDFKIITDLRILRVRAGGQRLTLDERDLATAVVRLHAMNWRMSKYRKHMHIVATGGHGESVISYIRKGQRIRCTRQKGHGEWRFYEITANFLIDQQIT